MPDCGVHYLWFAFVCFLIRSPPPSPWLKDKPVPCPCPQPTSLHAQGVAFAELDTSQWLYPAASFGSAKEGGGCEFNFGAAQFVHEPPKGFLALDPAHINLPPVFPFPRLFAFMDCCQALLTSAALPPFCSETAEVFTDKTLREGPQVRMARPCLPPLPRLCFAWFLTLTVLVLSPA